MEMRRSRRLQSKESVKENKSDSPASKKRKTNDLSSALQKKQLARPIKSSYFTADENNFDKSNIPAKRQARKTKSSYFESPIESDVESEYEANLFTSISPSKTRRKNLKKKKATSESESDSNNEKLIKLRKASSKKTDISDKKSFVTTKKKKQTYESESDDSSEKSGNQKRDSVSDYLSNTNSSLKVKNSYESESDSSSDEFVKESYSSLDLPKTDSPDDSNEESNDDVDDDAVDSKPAEYFDFTSLVSQVTEATRVAEETIPVDNQSEIKKENVPKETPEKKSKRGAKKFAKKSNLSAEPMKTEQLEVCELLAMGENTDLSAKDIKETFANSSENYEIPNQVEVLLDAPETMKKKRCNDLEIALRRRLNNIKRENQVYIHKVHVLCYIAHGNYLNSILNSPEALSMALSLLPSDKCYPPKRMSMEYLDDLLNWFGKKIKLNKDQDPDDPINLSNSLQKRETSSKTQFCFMFVCLLRALGIQCRLVINLNVAPIKPTTDQLLPINQKNGGEKPKPSSTKKETPVAKLSSKGRSGKNPEKSESNSKESKKNSSSLKSSSKKKESSYFKGETKPTQKSGRQTQSNSKYFEEDDEDVKKGSKSKCSRIKSKSKQKEEEEPLVAVMSSTDESDLEDFVSPKKKKIDRRVLSSEDDKGTPAEKNSKVDNKAKQDNKYNYWIEAFLEAEEKWFCIDVVKKSYHCAKQLYNNASHPVRYILAWNNDQTIKDVTRRYVPQYLSVTRKLRVDDNWLKSTLKHYESPSTPQNKEEDEELDKILEELPIPASISECKNHPLYAMKRHLLKFQAIYPSDAIPVGYIKGEPVYSRLCVQQLHGREMWIKEAKVVKLNETPYKIVKGRPQKSKFGTSEPPKDLELFGSWQVEDYVPPAAENGRVPRNSFGNVELFKMSMLPKGTVYLQLPGLQRIANKLNIDCAAAITGFEYSTNGWSYPVKDGFVVCEEFKDILLDAYNQEVEEAEKKEKLKREERVYANWKRLIKGFFIREKLKKKYNFGNPEEGTSESAKKKESK